MAVARRRRVIEKMTFECKIALWPWASFTKSQRKNPPTRNGKNPQLKNGQILAFFVLPFWGAKHDFSRTGVTNPFLGPGTSLQLAKKNLRIFQDFGGFLQKTKNDGKTLAQSWLMYYEQPIDACNGSNRSLGSQN